MKAAMKAARKAAMKEEQKAAKKAAKKALSSGSPWERTKAAQRVKSAWVGARAAAEHWVGA